MPVHGISLRLIDTSTGAEQPVRNSLRGIRSERLTEDEVSEARRMADNPEMPDAVLEEHLTALEARVYDRIVAARAS